MIKETFRQIPKKLASFSNDELYFIITELLGLNQHAKKLIVERSLYIKPSSNSIGEHLAFLLINKSTGLSKNQQVSACTVTLGTFDSVFTNIHLHTISCADVDNNCEVDIATIKVLLSGLVEPIVYHPVYLIEGLLKIIQQPLFADRVENTIFKIDLFENPYCHYFDLGIINDVDYSGMYYCIAQPDKKSTQPSTIIHHYNLEEMELYQSFAMPTLIKKDCTINDDALSAFR